MQFLDPPRGLGEEGMSEEEIRKGAHELAQELRQDMRFHYSARIHHAMTICGLDIVCTK